MHTLGPKPLVQGCPSMSRGHAAQRCLQHQRIRQCMGASKAVRPIQSTWASIRVRAQAATAQAATEQQVDPWARVVSMENTGETVEVVVKRANKGGLVVSLGELEAFMPYKQLASQTIRKGHLGDLSYLIGQRLKAKIVGVDMQGPKREIIVSEKKAATSAALARLKVGTTMRGVVRNVEEYGVFVDLVDLPGVSGLVHKSEISWDPIIRPGDVLQRGQLAPVKVIDVDPSKCRLALSIKQLSPDPLKQTLDTMTWGPTVNVLPEVQRVIDRLRMQPDIDQVVVGRQAQEQHIVSQELQVFLTRESSSTTSSNSHLIVARLGSVLQELQLITPLSRDQVKKVLQSAVVAQ